jgi:hypothetical protein
MDPVHDNAMLHWRNHSPHELQAAVSNVIGLIIIPRVPKFDVLWFFSFYESSFRRLIKGSNDFFNIIEESRTCQGCKYKRINLITGNLNYTSQEALRTEADVDGAIKMILVVIKGCDQKVNISVH